MAINFHALAETAYRLIAESGRSCTFIQYRDTPADADMPWKGPADPRASVEQSHVLPSLAVDVGTAKKLGMSAVPEDLLKRTAQFLVVASGDDFSGDLTLIHEVVDGDARHGVTHIEAFKPGTVLLLYFVGVAR